MHDQAVPVDDSRPVWTQIDCLQSHLDMDCDVTRGPIFTDRRMDDGFPSIDEWDENDMWETSTTLDEAEFLLDQPVRKVAKNGWKGTHQCASSGSTQGPATIGTLPEGYDLNAAERVRAWKRVRVMLGRHKGKKTGSRPVPRGL
ncbi:uncharacterized protein B0H18DRAFT_1121301 [Fomitopsis serialis]|uniref:uncharacterized protein n=1 Tax=Fomitopsis serialis TaxID=139415 RepID=UPI002008B138|nr:uncharacterized protein B0H18DRAFT_1121301 [Neoantrodia serialis]KAH9921606.1 hypothetical protein B0H18DRAFT_1121301 [Neoantrodia serialis]